MLLARLGGVLAATHARPRLVLAEHPRGGRFDAFWLVGGRVADWGPLGDLEDVQRRTAQALRGGDGAGATASLTPDEVDEARIVATWLDRHPRPHPRALARGGDERAGAARRGVAAPRGGGGVMRRRPDVPLAPRAAALVGARRIPGAASVGSLTVGRSHGYRGPAPEDGRAAARGRLTPYASPTALAPRPSPRAGG